MKPGKADVSGSYTSDSLFESPDSLYFHLSLVFKSFLIRGTVTKQILSCAFLPIFKGGFKNATKFHSYRALAGASQLLKLFEYVILLIGGDKLSSDFLQFGYKPGVSTNQCSWMVTEVANYFVKRGTVVAACAMDASQEFDKCHYSTIYSKLLAKYMPVTRSQPDSTTSLYPSSSPGKQ